MDSSKHVTDDDRRLVRLEELKGFRVADDDHDIRGWKVKTPDGTVGKVEELIVDPVERRVRYMEVKADRKALGIDDDRHVLIPVGLARLEDDGNDVLIDRLPPQGLAGAPAYTRGPITREYETSLRQYYGASAGGDGTDYYRDDLYSDSGFKRRAAAGTAAGTAAGALPRIGDNEVSVPLADDQEVIVRQDGSDQEIVIRKSTAGRDEARS
jgi:hypothetical protein